MLSSGTYTADVIQIEKIDAAGNSLCITKINETSPIIIDLGFVYSYILIHQ
jgi:hypothetical protein